jgi:hypothetical protein
LRRPVDYVVPNFIRASE